MPDAYRIPALSMVMLGVRNVNDSLLFYRDKLGMAVKQHFEGFAFLDAGAVMLILSEALAKNSPHTAGAVEVIFNVDAVNDHHNSLQNLGVEFLHAPTQRQRSHVGRELPRSRRSSAHPLRPGEKIVAG
jgi:catechol 2,3-dioxygenase-like lactoylglutathione lyase family enzyme